MKTKLVIFDLDGTLLNTAKNLQFCVNQALNEYSLKPITLKQTIAYVGNGAKKLIERAVGKDERIDDIFNTFMGMMKKYPTHLIKPYVQIKTLLKKLKKSGVKIAVFSNKPHQATQFLCDEFFTTCPFDFVLGQKPNASLKPDPDGVNQILTHFNVKNYECVFVGDGETDAQTALNAKVEFVGVLWGFRTKEILEKHGATQFVTAPSEILNFIN